MKYQVTITILQKYSVHDQYFVKQNLKYINRWRQWFYWVLILICNIFLGFDLRFYIFLQWLTFFVLPLFQVKLIVIQKAIVGNGRHPNDAMRKFARMLRLQRFFWLANTEICEDAEIITIFLIGQYRHLGGRWDYNDFSDWPIRKLASLKFIYIFM